MNAAQPFARHESPEAKPFVIERPSPERDESQNSRGAGHVRVTLSPDAERALEAGERSEPEQLSLSEEEQRQVQELRQRDAEVRVHEAAHVAAAGGHARGGPKYDYQTGPDGRRYAVGGSVDIDTSAVAGDPKATLAKASAIRRAALAPADPSSRDRAIAARASQMGAKARAELSRGGDTDAERDPEPHEERPPVSNARALAAYRRPDAHPP